MTDTYEVRMFTLDEAKEQGLADFPDCKYAEVYNGLNAGFHSVWVVKLWRDETCYLNDDPPRRERSYLAESKRINVFSPGGGARFGVEIERD